MTRMRERRSTFQGKINECSSEDGGNWSCSCCEKRCIQLSEKIGAIFFPSEVESDNLVYKLKVITRSLQCRKAVCEEICENSDGEKNFSMM
uniref:Uncharacterized protein n=1 Tax=Romanomermis culicivorax TaxID=13658 RepID=A0A915JDS4_ROMCU